LEQLDDGEQNLICQKTYSDTAGNCRAVEVSLHDLSQWHVLVCDCMNDVEGNSV
jgi:hypothetical protein